jgi:hypothetical protein
VLVIPGVCAAIGTVYDAAAGELTVSGPVVGLFVGLRLVLFEVLFPLQFMRRWQ